MAPYVEYLKAKVEEAESWLEEHGNSLEGYIERYGDSKEPQHTGCGGQAVYFADLAVVYARHLALAKHYHDESLIEHCSWFLEHCSSLCDKFCKISDIVNQRPMI